MNHIKTFEQFLNESMDFVPSKGLPNYKECGQIAKSLSEMGEDEDWTDKQFDQWIESESGKEYMQELFDDMGVPFSKNNYELVVHYATWIYNDIHLINTAKSLPKLGWYFAKRNGGNTFDKLIKQSAGLSTSGFYTKMPEILKAKPADVAVVLTFDKGDVVTGAIKREIDRVLQSKFKGTEIIENPTTEKTYGEITFDPKLNVIRYIDPKRPDSPEWIFTNKSNF
jgi:hypothetical protein